MIYNNIPENEIDTPLWRYIDLTKLLSLLENSELFCSKVDSFEDIFEGIHISLSENDYYGIKSDGKVYKSEKTLPDQQNITEIYKKDTEEAKENVAINCWRISKYESHAMWKIFLNSNEGVAIKTTVKSLKESIALDENQNVILDKVQYIDYLKKEMPVGNLFSALFHKNIYFEHEKEFRILTYYTDPTFEWIKNKIHYLPMKNNGLKLKIDYKKLIQEVKISPYAPKWFRDLVKKLLKEKYKLDINVEFSEIKLK